MLQTISICVISFFIYSNAYAPLSSSNTSCSSVDTFNEESLALATSDSELDDEWDCSLFLSGEETELNDEAIESYFETYQFTFKIIKVEALYCSIELQQIPASTAYKKTLIRELDPDLQSNLLGMRFQYIAHNSEDFNEDDNNKCNTEDEEQSATLEIIAIKVDPKSNSDQFILSGILLCEPLGLVSVKEDAAKFMPRHVCRNLKIRSWIGPDEKKAITKGLKKLGKISGKVLKNTGRISLCGLKTIRDIALAALESTKS